MKIKRVAFIIPIFFTMILSGITFAERKPLNPPAVLSFNPEKYLNNDYKQGLNHLRTLFEKSGDRKSVDIISSLFKATRKDFARKFSKELFYEIKKYEKRDIALYKEIIFFYKEIEQMIEDGSFNDHHTGVSFEVDEKNKTYIISWEENGKEVIKGTPFIPEMKLIVKGSYIPKIDTMMYQYWIENKKESKASFTQLYIESRFPQNFILRKIRSTYGRMTRTIKKSEQINQDISYPQGYLNYFRFFNYDFVAEVLINYKPGDQMHYPFELEEFEESLPGITECAIPVSDVEFNPTSVISPEKSPEIAVDIVGGKSLGPHWYRYWGKTIGPVPIPDPFSKTIFIEQIITYNNQSVEEGWNDKEDVIQFTKTGLEQIKNNPDEKEQIKSFLTKLDDYYKKDMILSEAYVLLKYNLEYLLSRM